MVTTSMASVLRARAAAEPHRPAVTVTGGGAPEETITFAELDRASDEAAKALVERGLDIGEMVTIALPNSIEFIVAAFAGIKAGATVQPVSHRLPLIERQGIVDLADSRLVIGVPATDHPDRSCVEAVDELVPETKRLAPDRVSPTWKATTSGGSSGRPKLIITTTPGTLDREAKPDYLLPKDDTVLIPGPLFHTAPFTMSLLGVLHGNHVVLQRRFDAAEVVDLIARHRPSFVLLVPTMMHRIWRLEPDRRGLDVSCIQTMFHMAAACPAWLKRWWIDWLGPEHVFELYGASDSPGNTVINGVEWLAHPGSVGRPNLGAVKVTDDEGRDLPSGEVGEIWMAPPPGTVSRARVVDGDARERDGWTSVGDLGWLDADGYLYIADRRSDLILTGGENVYPAEVEAALEQHSGVRSCLVVGLPDDDLGQRVHAVVEVADGVTEAILREHIESLLVRYKTPRTYELVDHPLRDDAGKARKSAVVDRILSQQAAER
jgi:bile acid-coenzyme A ligase